MSKEVCILIIFGFFILFAITFVICETVKRINQERNEVAFAMLMLMTDNNDENEESEEE